jgi:hypothetical protein
VGEDVPSSCLWLRMAGDVPSSMAEVMPTLGMAEIVQLGGWVDAGVADGSRSIEREHDSGENR